MISKRVCEAEQPRIESPGDVAQEQRLFPGKAGNENLVETRGQGGLAIQVRMAEKDSVVIEVDEVEMQRTDVKGER
ncbi:MAG TPA: hypothetical protein DEP35_00705 [Deltaproteobacteria bacterium]|nr:hypothetical protein [Deltaproteobacteria bacterium]